MVHVPVGTVSGRPGCTDVELALDVDVELKPVPDPELMLDWELEVEPDVELADPDPDVEPVDCDVEALADPDPDVELLVPLSPVLDAEPVFEPLDVACEPDPVVWPDPPSLLLLACTLLEPLDEGASVLVPASPPVANVAPPHATSAAAPTERLKQVAAVNR